MSELEKLKELLDYAKEREQLYMDKSRDARVEMETCRREADAYGRMKLEIADKIDELEPAEEGGGEAE